MKVDEIKRITSTPAITVVFCRNPSAVRLLLASLHSSAISAEIISSSLIAIPRQSSAWSGRYPFRGGRVLLQL